MPKKNKKGRTRHNQSPKRKQKHKKQVHLPKIHKEESSIEEMNPMPNHLFRAWSNPLQRVIKTDKNTSCTQTNCGQIHYKIVPNKFVIALCHFEGCNISDDDLIVLSPTFRSIFLDLFRENKLEILLQFYLNNNQIESYGLLTLLNVLSLPMLYVEYLSLSKNPTTAIGAYYINNYLEKCSVLPHRIHLSHTKMGNDGIHSIIKGMIKRKKTYAANTHKSIAMRVMELEQKLKAIHGHNEENNNDIIISGLAIDEEHKQKLYVPIAIIVDSSIDTESLALNATKNIFVCTGADYKYIGHGECDENYCAVAATICTEEDTQHTEINVATLPLIHLFTD
eukprot:99509_1